MGTDSRRNSREPPAAPRQSGAGYRRSTSAVAPSAMKAASSTAAEKVRRSFQSQRAAAALGLWEISGGRWARNALALFKEAATWAPEGWVRASGPFLYATVFSMFLEAAAPFVLWTGGLAGFAI